MIKYADAVDSTFPDMMANSFIVQRVVQTVIAAGREIVAEAGLFITKKRYAALVTDIEGFRTDIDGKPGKVKAMGLDLRRSDTPVFMQEFLSELLLMVLTDKPRKMYLIVLQNSVYSFMNALVGRKGHLNVQTKLDIIADLKKSKAKLTCPDTFEQVLTGIH